MAMRFSVFKLAGSPLRK